MREGVAVREHVVASNRNDDDDSDVAVRFEYELAELRSASSYEVRVSYPATVPLAVTIAFESEKNINDGDSDRAQRGSRTLLNTEKLMFRTDAMSRIEVRCFLLQRTYRFCFIVFLFA